MPLYRHLGGDDAVVLPVPMMNIINGGAHADNSLDIQEFMIVPAGLPSFSEALRCGAEIFHRLKKILHERKLATAVGDEGGFAPNLPSNEAALGVILEAIEQAGYHPARTCGSGLDVASSEFHRRRQLRARVRGPQVQRGAVRRLPRRRSPSATRSSRSRTAWRKRTGRAGRCSPQRLGQKVQLVGDDLFVTNTEILARGIAENVANAILIKPNQIGTLTETLAAIEMATRAGYAAVVSHRSGETEDATIADIAVGNRRRRRSRPARCRARTAWRSTTSCSGSRRSSARARATPAARPSRSSAGGRRD